MRVEAARSPPGQNHARQLTGGRAPEDSAHAARGREAHDRGDSTDRSRARASGGSAPRASRSAAASATASGAGRRGLDAKQPLAGGFCSRAHVSTLYPEVASWQSGCARLPVSARSLEARSSFSSPLAHGARALTCRRAPCRRAPCRSPWAHPWAHPCCPCHRSGRLCRRASIGWWRWHRRWRRRLLASAEAPSR